MKKLIWILFLPLMLMSSGLVTGQNIKFIPGDKVLFSEDFSKCPIGEIPTSFDKVKGSVECVKYKNHIWLSKNSNMSSEVFKTIEIGNNEFEIDFKTIGMNGYPGFVELELYDTNKTKDTRPFYKLGFASNWCEFSLPKDGGVFYRKKGCVKKVFHIAMQVRRNQLRIFINNKRVLNKLWNKKETIKMISFYSEGGPYNYLISDIRVAKYSSKEEAPKPESVGISVQKIDGGEKLTVPEKVLFDFNKFILKPKAKDALKVVGAYIAQNNPKKIVVTGYTDNIGSDEYNLKLSLQRAQSVADFLIYCGKIDAKKIEIKGLGKANPIAPNDSEQNRAKNRRVEIELIQ